MSVMGALRLLRVDRLRGGQAREVAETRGELAVTRSILAPVAISFNCQIWNSSFSQIPTLLADGVDDAAASAAAAGEQSLDLVADAGDLVLDEVHHGVHGVLRLFGIDPGLLATPS